MASIFDKEFSECKDIKYKEFNDKLANSKKKSYGITIPKQREIAKKYYKLYDDAILSKIGYESLEETNLYFLLLTKYYKDEECLDMIYRNAYRMDSWVNTDLTASCLKFIKKDRKRFYPIILKMLNDENLWNARLALVIFLTYYKEENYLEEIINHALDVKRNEYYFEMALAWFLSYVAIFNKDLFIKYIKDERLSEFSRKMAIRKSIESFRVDSLFKTELKKMLK